MLNRDKLAKELFAMRATLFPDLSSKTNIARRLWERITKDPLFSARALAAPESYALPRWVGRLDEEVMVQTQQSSYSVLAVDGSQIYPDRNMPGGHCCLINIGSVHFIYGDCSSVAFSSEPSLFLVDDLVPFDEGATFSKELVDLKREELELKQAVSSACTNAPSLCLVDGTLLFWYLEAKKADIRKHFFLLYLASLEDFYQNRIPVAGYISHSRSRELTSLLLFAAKEQGYESDLNHIIDRHVAGFFLKPMQRSTLFVCSGTIAKFYPDHLKPCFFYLHVGDEISRVEVPAWVAKDERLIQLVCGIVLDQVSKGYGYPICLAEAHEQAVVKGADRDFFYHLIHKIGLEEHKRLLISPKNLKKRRMGI